MFTVATRENDPTLAPLRAGLAVALSLEIAFGLQPRIKWPNDVVVNDRKICGILCEYSNPWLFTGMGVNLRQRSFPRELLFAATSVCMESGNDDPDRDSLLMTILEQLNAPPDDLTSRINSRLWRRGEAAELRNADGSHVNGTIVRVDSDGCLVVRRNGSELRLLAAEFVPGEGI